MRQTSCKWITCCGAMALAAISLACEREAVTLVLAPEANDSFDRYDFDEVEFELALLPAGLEDETLGPVILNADRESLPIETTIKAATVREVLDDGTNPLIVHAAARFKGVAVGSADFALDFSAGGPSIVEEKLRPTGRLDLMKDCANDPTCCSTGACGHIQFSESLKFCIVGCNIDGDCPPGARCTEKYGGDGSGTGTCIPSCGDGIGCQCGDRGGCDTNFFLNWQCNIDSDGLCGVTL